MLLRMGCYFDVVHAILIKDKEIIAIHLRPRQTYVNSSYTSTIHGIGLTLFGLGGGGGGAFDARANFE